MMQRIEIAGVMICTFIPLTETETGVQVCNKLFIYFKSCNNFSEFQVTCEIHSSSLQVLPLLVTANVVPISVILVTVIMEALHSSETSVLSRATRRTSQKTAFLN
jgi:hypothetical protein